MLQEAILYQDNFPISITVSNIQSYPIHYHKDIEIVYVLEGSVDLRNGYCTYHLEKGDIFTNAGHEVHTMRSDEENITAIFHVSNLFFTQFFPDLPAGCYRTNPTGTISPKLSQLKHTLLQLLVAYLQKDINYRDTCIEYCMELVRVLDQDFNLFAFQDNVVVHFSCDNPVIEERISHVINYIYANHELKISLDDLAEMEHLSSYYLSHLIKKYCGISFRDFLSFARTEWSEIALLETDKKINSIAQSVGFSTSRYYEDAFRKWFGHSPQEHREANKDNLLGPTNRPKLEPVPTSKAIDVARQARNLLISQDNNLTVAKSHVYSETITRDASPQAQVHVRPRIYITLADFQVIGYSIFDHLRKLNCQDVILLQDESDPPAEIAKLAARLKKRNFTIEYRNCSFIDSTRFYGFDSIAGLISLLLQGIDNPDSQITMGLRDQGEPEVVLKGGRNLLTSAGVPKSLYNGMYLLSKSDGELILQTQNYAVVKLHKGDAYLLITMNYNSEILGLCQRADTPYHVDEVLNGFQDELSLNLNMELSNGDYLITRYSASSFNSLFGIMSKLRFPEKLNLAYDMDLEYVTRPSMDAYAENVRRNLSVDMTIHGAGVQILLIQKML